MEQEHVMLATAGTLDWNSLPATTAGDSDLTLELDDTTDGDDHRRQLKRAVAALPLSTIAEMRRRELIVAIRTAELPWLDGADMRLAHADRATLERLVFLARRVCRRQLLDAGVWPRSNGGPQPDGRPAAHRHPARPAAAERVILDSLHREKAR